MTIRSEYFQGPLPPPALLEYYERTLTGAADRIFTSAEEQGRHRRTVELRSLDLRFSEHARGHCVARHGGGVGDVGSDRRRRDRFGA